MMKFERCASGCVLVSLTKADLQSHGLCFETLDYENSATRMLVRQLLQQVSSLTGVFFSRYRTLTVDVLPGMHGGCLMLLSQDALQAEPAIFVTDDIFHLIDAARVCLAAGCAVGGTLYQQAGALYLTTTSCSAAQRRVLAEYLYPLPVRPLEIARLEETATCLIAERALEILGGVVA